MNMDKLMKDFVDKTIIPTPKYMFNILNISFFIWDYKEYRIELVETYPYELDGQTPMLMIQIGTVEFMFYSKVLYKFIYKRKYGFLPRGLSNE